MSIYPDRKTGSSERKTLFAEQNINYLQASSTATATETVIPTMGLLPVPENAGIIQTQRIP